MEMNIFPCVYLSFICCHQWSIFIWHMAWFIFYFDYVSLLSFKILHKALKYSKHWLYISIWKIFLQQEGGVAQRAKSVVEWGNQPGFHIQNSEWKETTESAYTYTYTRTHLSCTHTCEIVINEIKICVLNLNNNIPSWSNYSFRNGT